jgi:hypothetical protein
LSIDKDKRQNSEKRKDIEKDIIENGKKLFKKFKIDKNLQTLSIINLRINQGDFHIINDEKEFLKGMLPNKKIRNLAMGLCGILTNPIEFKYKPYKFSNTFKYSATFDGANEVLSSLLSLNPIIPRLVAFDLNTYEAVQEKYGIPKEIVNKLPLHLI